MKWIFDWAKDMATIIILLLVVVVINSVLFFTGHRETAASLGGPLSLLAFALGFFNDNRRMNKRRRSRS